MTQIVLPYRPVAGDPEDVSQVMANFDAITSVVNGGLKDDNVAADAAIAATKLAGIPGSRVIFSRGTVPPGSPADGDLWQFAADANAGVYWLFRYNAGSASASKWEFLGGPDLYAGVEANESASAPLNSFIDLATVGPAITVPRAGDYLISFGAEIYAAATSAWDYRAAVKFGAAATVDADGIAAAGPNAGGVAITATVARTRLYPTLAAALALKLQYKLNGFAPVFFLQRWLAIRPVRVA